MQRAWAVIGVVEKGVVGKTRKSSTLSSRVYCNPGYPPRCSTVLLLECHRGVFLGCPSNCPPRRPPL